MKVTSIHHYSSKRQVIAAFKEGDMLALELIAVELAGLIKARRLKGLLVPVPSHSGMTIKLVKRIAEITGLTSRTIIKRKFSYQSSCIRRRHGLRPNGIDKIQNSIYALPCKAKSIIMVDDVMTSGNTLKACSKVLNVKNLVCITYCTATRKAR